MPATPRSHEPTTEPPSGPRLDSEAVSASVDASWSADVVAVLEHYITIPNKSPSFDPDWAANGHMDEATELLRSWAAGRDIEGLTVEVVRLDGRTPVILCEVPAFGDALTAGRRADGRSATDTVLLYGHLDKQPEMDGWDADKDPWTPVMVGERLYGRGGADDGYSIFSALTAIESVQAAGGAHNRAVVLIEASEESGSPDLPAYVDHLVARIGDVSLVVCLDSSAANYDQLWVTTSLRGLVGGVLDVRIVEQGVHSGAASGVVASSFRILRSLLSRLEDESSGEVLLAELHATIPDAVVGQANAAAALIGDTFVTTFPFVAGAGPMHGDVAELILNRTWRPALSIVGLDGAPPPSNAGNVLRPHTAVKLSIRLPPTVDPVAAATAVTAALTHDPPYGAQVTFDELEIGPGWAAPEVEPWLHAALDGASSTHFGGPAGFQGEGGSIPFMGMLGERFPGAQFVITGVLGPGSNAHGPNEFLDLPTARRVTACVAELLHAHALRG